MMNVSVRSAAAALICLAVLAAGPGCSTLVGRSNAGIELFEEGPEPVAATAVSAKYLGWVAASPLGLGLIPFAALAWATPWVDLATAVDIVTAPSVGFGFVTEAAIGAPLYAAVAPFSSARERPPHATMIPWGLVVAHREGDPDPRAPVPLLEETAAYYAVSSDAIDDLATALAEAEAHSGDGPATVRLDALGVAAALEVSRADRAAGDGVRPLVIMCPPTQGTFAARYLAARYADRGIDAAVIAPDAVFLDPALDAAGIEASLRAYVVASRAVIGALARTPDVGPIHYVGISAGGIFGVVLLAVEPQVERAALIFPGGDLATLIAVSDESTVTAYREAWGARGVSPAALSRAFAAEVRTEPAALARHVDPRRVLLFLSHGDTRVPIEGGRLVETAMGSPATWELAGNHQTSGICFGFVLRETEAFLLDLAPPAETPPRR